MLAPPYDYTPIIERAPITWQHVPGCTGTAPFFGVTTGNFALRKNSVSG